MNGIIPAQEAVEPASAPKEGQGSWNQTTEYKRVYEVKRRPTNMPRVAVKPQIHFKDKVDNSKLPFKPHLMEKPHAIRPLQLRLERGLDGTERLVKMNQQIIL